MLLYDVFYLQVLCNNLLIKKKKSLEITEDVHQQNGGLNELQKHLLHEL